MSAGATGRKVVDRLAARNAAYRGPENPFPDGSRPARYFVKERQRYEQMEGVMREMELVYGGMEFVRK